MAVAVDPKSPADEPVVRDVNLYDDGELPTFGYLQVPGAAAVRKAARGEGPVPEGLPEWAEVAMVRHSGSQVEIKTRSWDEQLPARLQAAGLRVQRVDRMALEDIFVTAVRAGGAA